METLNHPLHPPDTERYAHLSLIIILAGLCPAPVSDAASGSILHLPRINSIVDGKVVNRKMKL